MRNSNPFNSFWMAGYECTDKLNAFGHRVDLLELTGHLALLNEDYRSLPPAGIRTVREGIRWSQVEKRPGQFDWATVTQMVHTARVCGIQQVWDLCHFGYPDDLTPLHPLFARRFAALCRSFVIHYRSLEPDLPLIVTPINEVSFISWLGGEVRGTVPFCIGQGWEVKYALMRAYIEGINALREIDGNVRIMTTEPLVNMVPPEGATPEQVTYAALQHEEQYQSVDMLCGRICPELGGTPDHLDILGFNYYYNNQWVVATGQFLPWANEANDPRWRPLSSLLTEAFHRYGHPIVLSETSHPGQHRPQWITFVGEHVKAVLEQQVPLWGVCLYPVIDRPDWNNTQQWHEAGLWDMQLQQQGPPVRVLNQPYAAALRRVQESIRTLAAIPVEQQPYRGMEYPVS
jgi:hypothetical protein